MKKEQGITLIALVVTIVVLLILAAVSISMLTGENGIVTQASKAKDETEQARVQELVDLAVNSLIGENMGSTNGITPQMVAEEVNEMENREDVYAERSEFPTQIIFPEEGRKVEVNLEPKVDLSEIYEVAVDEEDIAPSDLFDYEIIDDAEVGAVTLSALPTKKARILRIKQKYCSGVSSSDGTYEDTNYEIIYEGEKISDTLIIPYQVELEGEMYTITEVNLHALGDYSGSIIGNGYSFPEVETVIYPNTVEKISGRNAGLSFRNKTLKNVILSTNLNTIGKEAFYGCEKLENITIPESVTFIGEKAFWACRGLTSITIPESVTSVDYEAFDYWTSTQTINVPFKDGETPEGWAEDWKGDFSNAKINYLK